MGALGKELFLECGYPERNVFITGSPRYDHIKKWLTHASGHDEDRGRKVRVLMVLTLSTQLELEDGGSLMCCHPGDARLSIISSESSIPTH
jgi:hypothetical protein